MNKIHFIHHIYSLFSNVASVKPVETIVCVWALYEEIWYKVAEILFKKSTQEEEDEEYRFNTRPLGGLRVM